MLRPRFVATRTAVVGFGVFGLASAGLAQAPITIDPSPVSFLCYTVRQPRGVPRFGKRPQFWVRDRLRRTLADVLKPEQVCNATDTAGSFDDRHLAAYRARRSRGVPRFAAEVSIPIDNALGRTNAVPKDRGAVFVPAALNVGGPATPLDPLTEGDAYSCYRVRGSRRVTGLPRGLQVSLTDPFNGATVYDVVRPTRLCYAAAAEQPPAADPGARLLCYSLRRAEGESPGSLTTDIHIDDRFGALTLDTTGRASRAAELCLASTIPDSDADGLNDEEEALRGTGPQDADSDNDGVPDGYEVEHGFNPLGATDGAFDADGDFLDTLAEFTQGTDPRSLDTDGDGLEDGLELSSSMTSPLLPDTDGDGITDAAELNFGLDPLDGDDAAQDPDVDGLPNAAEVAAGTGALDPDTDNDGLLDGEEVNLYATDPLDSDSDGDGVSDGDEVDVYGTDPNAIDTDSGGRDDFAELTIDTTDPLDGGDDVQAFPPLLSTEPVNGAGSVSRTAWLRLRFSRPVDAGLLSLFTFTCGASPQAATFHIVDADVVVNPTPELPTSTACSLDWPGYSGPASLSFTTSFVGATATVLYDRDDTRARHPFPDDF